MKNSFISVIIPAAGSGKRMNSKMKKQFILLDGKPIIYHTVKKFEESSVSEIIVVCPKDDIDFMKELLIEFKKVVHIVSGGKERQDSVVNGLSMVSHSSDIILVHDGVRPLIRHREINELCNSLILYDAAVIAVPVKNTIKKVEQGFVKETPDRSTLWAIQTPQGMKANVFRECYTKLQETDFLGTDESMIAEHFGYDVHVVEGDYTNIKITTPEDLDIGNLFLRKEKNES